ncbi:MAG: hypothetical protein CL908_06050 [Deltaproteobacteria bacterium]|nr:hypothetical protein [Deltaproteobacteria bacterium]
MPSDFPYWEHITQRRYEGPSVIYLGGGWALTARHVGMGEIFLAAEIYKPVPRSRRTLLNENGRPADVMLFEIDRSAGLPDLPLLPIATEPVQPGDQVLLIGFGRGRNKVIEWEIDGETRFGFLWDETGAKRWGTNRVETAGHSVTQNEWTTFSFTFDFDEPLAARTTLFEAHAATGDSGGAVFVRRNETWMLVGMMASISGTLERPEGTATYGDRTYAADLAFYRSEIHRWTRTACANEVDDDGDGEVDFPNDPGCEDLEDRDERNGRSVPEPTLLAVGMGGLGAIVAFVGWSWWQAQRGRSTPASTSSSITR